MKLGYLKQFSLLAFVLLGLFFNLSFALPIDKIIVFGDSLSDNGNIFSLTSTAHKAVSRVPIIPKGPYYQGRFSNGPVWVDNLAQTLNVPVVNYAYAGSWAEPYHDSNLIIPFSLDMQVNFYLMTAPFDRNKDQHLYVIWSGGNDYIDGRKDIEYATTNAISYIQKQIEWLVYYGAKHFLILNVPDLGNVPYVASKNPGLVSVASKLSHLHNQKFIDMITQERILNPKIDIVTVDIETYFNDMIANPEKYLLKNVTTPCYKGNPSWSKMINNDEIAAAKESNIDILNTPSLRVAYIASQPFSLDQGHCTNSEEYLFWDSIHPTQVVHQLIARLALLNLGEKGMV